MPTGTPPIGLFRTFARNLPMTVTRGTPDDPCRTAGREPVLTRVAYALHDSSDIDDEVWRADITVP